METRVQYVLVGLFVLVLGAAGIGISLWLAFGDISQQYKTYKVYMTESVSGLYVDAPVKYRGVEIGKVTRLDLDPVNPQRVAVWLDIKPEVPIRVDTVATLNVQGLTGIASIELSGGSPESPLLEKRTGENYPVIRTGPSLFRRFDTAISELIRNLNQVTADLHVLMGAENRIRITEILDNTAKVTSLFSDQRQQLEQGITGFARFSSDLATAGQDLPSLMAAVTESAESVRRMAEEYRAMGNALKQQMEVGGDAIQRLSVDTVPEMQRSMVELQSLINSLQQLADGLEQDPSQLLYGPSRLQKGPGE